MRVHHPASGITRIATESRSQLRNRVLALERVDDELRRRARKPKPRRPTGPHKAAVQRRLDTKRRASTIKRLRTRATED